MTGLTVILLAETLRMAAHAADLMPLHLELPKPMLVGTPRPIELPNLEKLRVGRRPDLMVPAGTILLSKGKPVTSSDSYPVIGEPNLVTDSDKPGVDGACVRLEPGLQWVRIDLGAPAAPPAIHRRRESRPAEPHPGKSALAAITETMKHRATCRLVAILSPRLSDV